MRISLMASIRGRWTTAAVVAFSAACLSGCGDSDDKRVSSATSKYEVGDEKLSDGTQTSRSDLRDGPILPKTPSNLDSANEADDAPKRPGTRPAEGKSSATPGRSSNTPRSTKSPDAASSSQSKNNADNGSGDRTSNAGSSTTKNGKAGNANSKAPASGDVSKSATAKGGGRRGPNGAKGPTEKIDPRNLPDGTAAELLELLEQLRIPRLSGRTRDEQMDELRNIITSRILLSEKIIDMEGATEDERYEAARHKIDVILLATKYGFPGTDQQLFQFCEDLKTKRSNKLSRLSRLTLFQLMFSGVAEGNSDEAVTIMTDEMFDILKLPDPDADVFQAVSNGLAALQQGRHIDSLAQALTRVGTVFQDSPQPEIASQAQNYLDIAATVELKFGDKLEELVKQKNEQAAQELLEIAGELIKRRTTTGMLALLSNCILVLESGERMQEATQLRNAIEQGYSAAEDAELKRRVANVVAKAKRRADMLGNPYELKAVVHDGSAFDWSKYQGKVVLVFFWTATSEASMTELANARQFYLRNKKDGFEVVGVNLDTDPRILQEFFKLNSLPFVNVINEQDSAKGFDSPLAVEHGVDSLPSAVLIGRDGKVAALHVVGSRMLQKVAELLAPEGGKDEGGQPSGTGDTKPDQNGADKSKDGDAKSPAQPPPDNSSRNVRPHLNTVGNTVAFDEAPLARTAGFSIGFNSEESTGDNEPGSTKDFNNDDEQPLNKPTQDAASQENADRKTNEENPYAARGDMTPMELAEFLLAMQDKPKTIQSRPGFWEAVVEAAERLLESNPNDKLRTLAATTKFATLHKQACLGNIAADQKLVEFTRSMKDVSLPRIASEVTFFDWERKAIEGEQVAVEQLESLLSELKDFFAKEKLDARHLRMASSTVRVINRLEDGDQREKLFKEFGDLFAKAQDKELSRYGKKLAKPTGVKESELVGKPLELSGTTANGVAFNWDSFRGKVVIVDFWATWCGPCIREMPRVKTLHEKLHPKGLEIVGVSLDKDPEALAAFLEKNPLPWETLAGDDTQELAGKYAVRAIPTMMLVDREGKIVAVSHSCDQLVPLLEKLLDK